MTVHHLTCAQCGATFDAVRNDARFCSPACRQDSHRGLPPRQQPRAQRPEPASAPPPPQQEPPVTANSCDSAPPPKEPPPKEPPPKEPPPLDPDRRAWLSFQGRRCWFQINWDPHPLDFSDPTFGAHEELGQWWIGNTRVAVDSLRRQLRHSNRAEVFDYEPGGPLPDLFLLELQFSPHPLEQAIHALLRATPPERWRAMVKRLAAYAHPDGVSGYRPRSADHLLEICYALKDEPGLG